MNFLIFFTFFMASISSSLSYEVPAGCESPKKRSKDCSNCRGPESSIVNIEKFSEFTNKVAAPIETLELFTEKANRLRAANLVVKDNLGSLFRTLRDKEKEPTYQSGIKEIGEIEEDFKQLTLLSKEAIQLQRKLNICITNCSAVRKMELNKDIERVQKLKSIILIKQPLLANSSFEEIFTKMSDNDVDKEEFISRDIFEQKLFSALFENLQGILKKENEFERFSDDPQKPYIRLNNIDHIKNYNENIIERFPLISESVVLDLSFNEAAKSPPNKCACYLTQRYKSYTSKKDYQEFALDITLFALPFALGPIGRASELSIELILGKRLATYGLKASEASRAIKLTNIAILSSVTASDLSQIANDIKKCKQKEAEFISAATGQKLEGLKECKKELSNKIILTEISAIPLLKTDISQKILSLLKTKSSLSSAKTPGTISLLLKDFGAGKNKIIKTEMDNIVSVVREEKIQIASMSSNTKKMKPEVDQFLKNHQLAADLNRPVQITTSNLSDYQKNIGKDTVELLYIPGADVPHLPNAVKRVGHIALRIGDKVYHQTGGSGFKIETFENFLGVTKKNYKVYGQVIESSEKEKLVMKSYFQKVYEKQLPYSFLVNNCSQSVCRSMGLADIEKINPAAQLDPFLTQRKIARSDRVVMKTAYNTDKDLSDEDLLKATAANRLAFYGIPAAGAATTAGLGVEAVDFVIEYLNQIKETK
ncbi:MAG: hypothetical protein WC635_14010 [Bacteriovorax sp.]